MKVPQPFPYQGSKRNLAPAILRYFPEGVATLVEPFAGSAAITLSAAAQGLAQEFVINDANKPLIELWQAIINSPEKLARQYESLWRAQQEDRRKFYDEVREEFNRTGKPDRLLYLLARCVKAAVRYNADGGFNQSPDNRRMGMAPQTMRENLLDLLRTAKDHGQTVVFSSHVLTEVETVCDRVAILTQGELKAEGKVNELVELYQQRNLEQVFLKIIGYHESHHDADRIRRAA